MSPSCLISQCFISISIFAYIASAVNVESTASVLSTALPITRSATSSSTSTSIPEAPEYSFLYPVNDGNDNVVVNYKDTLEISWFTTYPNNPPKIQISCWNRTNSSTRSCRSTIPQHVASKLTYPSKDPAGRVSTDSDVATVVDSGITTFNLAFEPYKTFNPCQLRLVDSVNETLGRGDPRWGVPLSALIEILDDDSRPSRAWNASVEAPLTTGWPTSGASNWRFGCEHVYILEMALFLTSILLYL